MEIQTFGAVFLPELAFRRPKPLLLLTYLSLEGPQPRRELSELFWPDASDPRDSLSTTVSRLNRAHDGLITVAPTSLSTTVGCDAKRLIGLLDAGHYRTGCDLFAGPFLQGLELKMSPELENWVYDTRDYLTRRVRGALLALMEADLLEGDIADAGRRAEAVVRMSEQVPVEADEIRALYRVLSLSDSPLVAKLLDEAHELGVDLHDSERGTDAESAGPESGRLPQATSSFIGRTQELAAIKPLLENPSCRIITIHGPGGIGKTRLALETAREHVRERGTDRFTVFVELEHLESIEGLPTAVADAVGLTITDETDQFQQLCAALRDRAYLLVLDNFDSLTEGAERLSELVRNCPRLTLLITSRELLHLAEEHVIPVSGLSVGSDGDQLGEAVDLLLDRVQRSHGPFDPNAQDLLAATSIAEMVDGSPLGIELVASWANVLPLPEIAASLADGPDLLVSRDRNIPARQRDLAGVFDQSWRLLSAAERSVFTRLAVFRGSFTLQAVEAVAAADRATLASLVDRSLVSMDPRGRFYLHSLLRLASEDKLATDPQEAALTEERHCHYYLDGLTRPGPHSLGTDVHDNDFDNLRAAWSYALATADFERVARATPMLADLVDRRARFLEGRTLLLRAAEALRDSASAEAERLEPLLGAHIAWLSYRLGDHQGAIAAAAPLLFPPFAHEPVVTFLAHKTVAASRLRMGAYREAAAACEAALELSGTSTEAYADPEVLEMLGMAHCEEGRFDTSRSLLSRALTQYRSRGDTDGVAGALNQLATVYLNLQQPLDAKPLFEEGLRLARDGNREDLASRFHYGLGITALELGDHPQATERCSRALFAARSAGDASRQAAALSVLYRSAALAGDMDAARPHLVEGLSLALSIGEIPRTLKFLTYTAEVWLLTGTRQLEAARLLEFVLAQPQVAYWTRLLAERLLPNRAASLSPSRVKGIGIDVATFMVAKELSQRIDEAACVGRTAADDSLTYEEAVGMVLAFAAGT